MAFEEMKIEDSDLVGKQISELADVPELSADDLKKRFDSISKDVIIPKFNLLLLGLVAESAAASIGITPPEGVSADANIAAVVAAISAAVKTNTESRHSHENKVTLDSLTSSVIAGYNRIVTLLQGISNVSNQVSDDENTVPTGRAIVDYMTELGGGDMLKSVYDANGNGVVDNSEKLGGKLPTYYQPSTDNTLNTSSKSVSGAINEVYSMAQNGGKQLVGDEFDPEKENYAAGDLCIKDNVLYKFTEAKPEKGWDTSKVVATTVDAELQSLNTKIGNYPDSDEEIVVGTFCGKPLYRKRILNGTVVSSGLFSLDTTGFSLELLVGVYGCIKTGQGDSFPVNFSDDGQNVSNVYMGADKVIYVIGKRVGAFNGFYGWIYIEYTKTTD